MTETGECRYCGKQICRISLGWTIDQSVEGLFFLPLYCQRSPTKVHEVRTQE